MKTMGAGRSRPVPTPPRLGGDSGIPEQFISYIVRAGAQAPSWYNCQPWWFEVDGRCIDVHLDENADTSLCDWQNVNSTLACGAAVENMVIASAGRGLSASVDSFPDPSRPLLVARLGLSRGDGSTIGGTWGHELEEAIWQRHTNTLMYDDAPADDYALRALSESIDEFPGVSLELLSSPEGKRRVFEAASTAEQVRFSRRDLHEHLHRLIRWTDADAERNRTGYTLPSMGACGVGEAFFRLTRPWGVMQLLNLFGAHRNQARRACLGLLHCSAVGSLTLRGSGPSDLLAGGRALERLWLTATALGLDLQPHCSLTLFDWIWRHGGGAVFSSAHQEILGEAFRLYREALPGLDLESGRALGIFLFRVGRGEPVRGFTLRRDETKTTTKNGPILRMGPRSLEC